MDFRDWARYDGPLGYGWSKGHTFSTLNHSTSLGKFDQFILLQHQNLTKISNAYFLKIPFSSLKMTRMRCTRKSSN